MSWTSCMKDKIIDHYGEEVAQCVDGITKDNFKDVLSCMANVLKVADPTQWIEDQLGEFGKWSLECAF